MITQLTFVALLAGATYLFSSNIKKIIRNIRLGKELNRSNDNVKRWQTMLSVALGQSKMGTRPLVAFLHLIVYAGFIIINLEVLEIMIDGVFGTHRFFSPIGGLYNFLIGSFEVLALLVALACAVFLIRRNVLKIKRFSGVEMTSFPRSDANYILFTEIILMSAFLTMNAADFKLQLAGVLQPVGATAFPISQTLIGLLPDGVGALHLIERSCWWLHIIGILAFLNYLPYSKHLHILLAFPNTYFSNLNPKGQFSNMESVTNEVKAMLDPSFVPPPPIEGARFGAKDVTDLSWVNLLNAYSCTECGRCTSVCPANQTGKLLSPRKIMMDTRDRITEVGESLDKQITDEKSLLDHYISREEIWACTSCNACTEMCPVNIDPLAIILELRRYIVMEESQAPNSLNGMLSNIENNGAPWKYAPSDRLNWANNIQ